MIIINNYTCYFRTHDSSSGQALFSGFGNSALEIGYSLVMTLSCFRPPCLPSCPAGRLRKRGNTRGIYKCQIRYHQSSVPGNRDTSFSKEEEAIYMSRNEGKKKEEISNDECSILNIQVFFGFGNSVVMLLSW